MAMPAPVPLHAKEMLETGAVALLFACTFLAGGHVRVPTFLMGGVRGSISFGGGMSIAYVFVHVMPELHDVRHAFATSVSVPLRYEGMAIYFVALTGFLLFYALDHLRKQQREALPAGQGGPAFRIQLGGFTAYVLLMGYLLVRNLDEAPTATVLYAVAIAFHFKAIDHSLYVEHGHAYQRVGRLVLGVAALLGWGLGLLFGLPHDVLALLMAFVSGGIIMNSALMELPSEKGGRFWPFVTGGLAYGLVLLPLGSTEGPGMDDTWKRIVDNLGARVSGPMKFRIFLQPIMASIFAILAGLKDARAGRPAYFWALLTRPAERASMVKDGWKSVGKVFVLALVLDVIYQVVEQRFVYPGEAVLVALFLAIVPYLILRGPVTRLARRGLPGAAGGNPRGGSPPGPAQGK